MNETPQPLNHFRIALQSGFAAGLTLGLPAGLLFWLILLQEIYPNQVSEQIITFLQVNALNKVFVLVFCSLLWSYLLSKISKYKKWLQIALATVLGIMAGWFSPLSNLDGLFSDQFPIHILYAFSISGLIFNITFCVGLAYGILLKNLKATLILAFTTSFASVITFILMFLLFEQIGIRVGVTPLAMSKTTASGLMLSGIMGGAMLGLGFSKFIKEEPVI